MRYIGKWLICMTLSSVDFLKRELLYFFSSQMQGVATRALGHRFRLDDGESGAYSGPFYDIYQIDDRIKVGNQYHEQSKLFYINSDTKLFERIRYRGNADEKDSDVEVRLSGWRKAAGSQQIPETIERLENNQRVLVLNLSSAESRSRVDDGIFKPR
jgi:hypothetical protein